MGWFREGRFSPLYLFYGEEDFLIDELVALLSDRAIDASMRDFNQDVVTARDLSAPAIASLAGAYPMMGDRRLVVVRNIDALPTKDLHLLLPCVQEPLATTILACTAEKPDFRSAFYKAFQAHGVIVESRPLYDNQVAGWIAERVRALGKRISPAACQVMQGYVSTSLREIQNEIDKLFTYVGDKPEISADDVTQVVGMSKSWNIFELQKAVGQRHIARSLEISERLLHPPGNHGPANHDDHVTCSNEVTYKVIWNFIWMDGQRQCIAVLRLLQSDFYAFKLNGFQVFAPDSE